MLKTRIIPILLIEDGLIKKPIQFQNPRTIANPISIARVFEERQVDELILLDISKTIDNEEVDLMLIKQISEQLFVPFSYGGGIKSVNSMIEIVKSGAEKIVLNTAAVKSPNIVREGAEILGRQCIVVSIDVKYNGSFYEVFTHSGSQKTGINILDHIENVQRLGAGELLINSIMHDGKLNGFNLELYNLIKDLIKVPVIAAGGASKLEDFIEIASIDQISAIAAGSIYHYTKITPNMVKGALNDAGIPVRICSNTNYTFNY